MGIAQILMGWPAIIASLILAGVGIFIYRPAYLIAACVLSLGFALYLTLLPIPAFKLLGLLLPLFLLGGALAVHRRIAWVAWLLLLPQAAITLHFGIGMLMQ
ncbi:hypothetical protein [Calderihabitans maritimus]|uniref:Uncharacterized protein n=1 Tax=Calderihabitans maritimus TaxID=1246530 RepID=A0A1Z5HXW0_9FIRM|nr:hypothetical protein [Calderihabitans maritimus]GAW94344.1 hypothetical protein KKC1_34520 [Calderihabitans maritimus]